MVIRIISSFLFLENNLLWIILYLSLCVGVSLGHISRMKSLGHRVWECPTFQDKAVPRSFLSYLWQHLELSISLIITNQMVVK